MYPNQKCHACGNSLTLVQGSPSCTVCSKTLSSQFFFLNSRHPMHLNFEEEEATDMDSHDEEISESEDEEVMPISVVTSPIVRSPYFPLPQARNTPPVPAPRIATSPIVRSPYFPLRQARSTLLVSAPKTAASPIVPLPCVPLPRAHNVPFVPTGRAIAQTPVNARKRKHAAGALTTVIPPKKRGHARRGTFLQLAAGSSAGNSQTHAIALVIFRNGERFTKTYLHEKKLIKNISGKHTEELIGEQYYELMKKYGWNKSNHPPHLLSITISRAPCEKCIKYLCGLLDAFPNLIIRIKATALTDESGLDYLKLMKKDPKFINLSQRIHFRALPTKRLATKYGVNWNQVVQYYTDTMQGNINDATATRYRLRKDTDLNYRTTLKRMVQHYCMLNSGDDEMVLHAAMKNLKLKWHQLRLSKNDLLPLSNATPATDLSAVRGTRQDRRSRRGRVFFCSNERNLLTAHGLRTGIASGAHNNCLIDSLLQLTGNEGIDARNITATRIRLALVSGGQAQYNQYLSVDTHASSILRLYDLNFNNYTIITYYTFQGNLYFEQVGDGNTILYLWNTGNHYEPVFPQ